MYRILLFALILLFGLAPVIGGIWLVVVGGTWFYLGLGAVLVSAAVFLFASRPAGLALYGFALLGTLVWALLEVGLDWWALAPRGAVLVVIGLLLLPLAHSWFGHPQRRDGRQYLAVVAGGHAGDAIVAYALPSSDAR